MTGQQRQLVFVQKIRERLLRGMTGGGGERDEYDWWWNDEWMMKKNLSVSSGGSNPLLPMCLFILIVTFFRINTIWWLNFDFIAGVLNFIVAGGKCLLIGFFNSMSLPVEQVDTLDVFIRWVKEPVGRRQIQRTCSCRITSPAAMSWEAHSPQAMPVTGEFVYWKGMRGNKDAGGCDLRCLDLKQTKKQ